jgi:hypothetical protein
MDPRFAAEFESLHGSYESLIGQAPRVREARWPREKLAGIYLFSEGDRHLYVGRSNNIRQRYSGHWGAGAIGSFAMKLAREITNRPATYRAGPGSQKDLLADPAFRHVFAQQKARISDMHFRYVEEASPVRQCLLEVYCAVVLCTPYNDFDNH